MSRSSPLIIAGAALALAVVARAGDAVSNSVAPFLDGASDRVIDRAIVPDPARKVGEVRLVKRGDADVVETLLYTALVKRVVGEIRKKELANWPEGRDGHADSARYVAALEQVRTQLADRQPAIAKDRRVRLFIDFVLTPSTALVAIGGFDMEERDRAVRVTSREPLVVLDLPRAYVRENMRLIIADSFGVDGAALEAKLAPLGVVSEGKNTTTDEHR